MEYTNYMIRRRFREGLYDQKRGTVNMVTFVYDPIFNYETDFGDNYFDDSILTDNYEFWNDVSNSLKNMVKSENYDLAEYVPKSLEGKVVKISLDWDSDNDQLLITSTLTVPFETIKDELIDYIEGQLSDGWGEGFEQQPVAKTEVYVAYNENDTNDVLYFGTKRAAQDYCDVNAVDPDDYEDADPDDIPQYEYDRTTVTLYVSFWDVGQEGPAKIIQESTRRNRNSRHILHEYRTATLTDDVKKKVEQAAHDDFGMDRKSEDFEIVDWAFGNEKVSPAQERAAVKYYNDIYNNLTKRKNDSYLPFRDDYYPDDYDEYDLFDDGL